MSNPIHSLSSSRPLPSGFAICSHRPPGRGPKRRPPSPRSIAPRTNPRPAKVERPAPTPPRPPRNALRPHQQKRRKNPRQPQLRAQPSPTHHPLPRAQAPNPQNHPPRPTRPLHHRTLPRRAPRRKVSQVGPPLRFSGRQVPCSLHPPPNRQSHHKVRKARAQAEPIGRPRPASHGPRSQRAVPRHWRATPATVHSAAPCAGQAETRLPSARAADRRHQAKGRQAPGRRAPAHSNQPITSGLPASEFR